MRDWMKWGGVAITAFALAGCGPKGKSCTDLQALVKAGMTEDEAIAALGKPDETGLGLAGDYVNYKCGGDGEFVSLIIRGKKVSQVVKIGGPAK
jgi:hypothetical protein